MVELRFPDGFLWGAATSAFQIEGAPTEQGRGPSIWDHFCESPHQIVDGSDGLIACDHYHRYRGDIDLLAQLGLDAYRFSVSWPRVFPDGRVENPDGLDFYDRLVDALHERGVEPWLTLYHWDMPQALEASGAGWSERASVGRFSDYAEAVAKRLGDRVRHWITINEPWCVSMLGFRDGHHAPGKKDTHLALRAAHHLLLAHGRAVPAVRAHVPEAKVGITLNLVPGTPASESEADREACRRFEGAFNRWFTDPIFRGDYPEDATRDYVEDGALPKGMNFIQSGDLEDISVPTDFLGVNYYTRAILRSDRVSEAENAPRTIPEPSSEALTEMGWEVYPKGLEEVLLWLHRNYAPPKIYITENGCAIADEPDEEGHVVDAPREKYLREHLASCHAALEKGVPLEGYFVWSLLDNFEWAYGYTKRFGITWVDFETQRRVLKGSARFYQGVVQTNVLPREEPS